MIKLNEIKKCNFNFLVLSIYLILLVFIPKDLGTLFGVIPVRLVLSILFLFTIFFYNKNEIFKLKSAAIKFLIVIYLLFLLFTIPSIFVSKSILTSCYTFIKFLIIPFLAIVCFNFKPNEYDKKLFWTTIIFITLLLVITSFIQYSFNIDLIKLGVEKYPGAKGRVSTTFFNTIYYGIFLNLVYCLFFTKFIKSNNVKMNIFYFILVNCIFVSLLLTFTRSAFLIFSGILFLLIVLTINKKNIVKDLFVIVFVISLIFIVPGAKYMVYDSINDGTELLFKVKLFEKESDTKYNGDLSLIHREQFADIAKKVGNDNLFTGIGFGTYINYMNSDDFNNLYPNYNGSKTHPHSAFVLMYSETGIMSTILFFLFSIYIPLYSFVKVIKNIKQRNDYNYMIYVLAFVMSIGFLIVNIIAENAVYDTQIFPLYILIIFTLYSFINKSKFGVK